MGTEQSKAHVEHNGDQHVEIINMQGDHSEKIDKVIVMLWLLCAMIGLQLSITLISEVNRYLNKKALKKAKSLVELSKV